MSKTVFLAIWADDEKRIVIECKPLVDFDEALLFIQGIEIVSVDIQPRPRCAWEIRQAERRNARYIQPSLPMNDKGHTF